MGNYNFKDTQTDAITDDTGGGTDGTILDKSWMQTFKSNDLEAGLYVSASDANAFLDFNGTRKAIAFGSGGASALDTFLEREASEVLAVRNAGDSAYGILRGLDPVGSNDYVTKGYADTNYASSTVPVAWHGGSSGAGPSETRYASMDGTTKTTEAEVRVPFGIAATLTGLYVTAEQAVTGSETVDMTLRKNGVDTGITVQLTGGATEANITGESVAVVATDDMTFEIVGSSGAPSSNTIVFSAIGTVTAT